MNRAVVLLFLIGMLPAAGCLNPGDCLITNSGTVQLALVDAAGRAREVRFASISVVGVERPLSTNSNTSTLALPLNPDTTVTSFVFTRVTAPDTPARLDTLTFTYRNQVLVLSPDCGAILFHRDLDYTRNTFGAGTLTINNRVLARGVTRNATLRF